MDDASPPATSKRSRRVSLEDAPRRGTFAVQYQKMHIDRLEAYSRDDDSHALVVEVIGVASPNEPPLVGRRLTAFPLAVRARVASWTVPNEDGVAVAVEVQGASILHETLHNNVNGWLGEAPGWDGNCGGCQSLARL